MSARGGGGVSTGGAFPVTEQKHEQYLRIQHDFYLRACAALIGGEGRSVMLTHEALDKQVSIHVRGTPDGVTLTVLPQKPPLITKE